MRGLLASPRRRRRLARVGLLALVVGSAVTVSWLARDSGRDFEPAVRGSGPAQTVQEDVEVAFTPKVEEEILPVASRFVATAVERKNLDESYELVHPQLRQGYTLKQWRTGEIPVVPYPVGGARWDVQYSFADSVGLYVLLMPKQGADVRPTTFLLELKPVGRGESRRWLVSGWVPSASSGQLAVAASSANRPLPLKTGAFEQGNLSPLFLLVPIGGTIGLVLAAAGFFLVRSSMRNRRASRAYGEKKLPELPRRV